MPLWAFLRVCVCVCVCVCVRARARVRVCLSQGHRWLYAGHDNHLLYAWLIINNLLRPVVARVCGLSSRVQPRQESSLRWLPVARAACVSVNI